jgi:cell division protein ZapA (FtsZ GTPase activity inhibitor)
MDDEKFNIHLNVAGKYYPLTILRKDEEKFRKAAKLISEKVLLYRKSYSEGEERDYLAMAAVDLVSALVELENKKDINPLIEEIRDINSNLENFLKGEQQVD